MESGIPDGKFLCTCHFLQSAQPAGRRKTRIILTRSVCVKLFAQNSLLNFLSLMIRTLFLVGRVVFLREFHTLSLIHTPPLFLHSALTTTCSQQGAATASNSGSSPINFYPKQPFPIYPAVIYHSLAVQICNSLAIPKFCW